MAVAGSKQTNCEKHKRDEETDGNKRRSVAQGEIILQEAHTLILQPLTSRAREWGVEGTGALLQAPSAWLVPGYVAMCSTWPHARAQRPFVVARVAGRGLP